MSEYQYVAFRAVDRPVSGENLEFMHRQSSRAEITSWSFDNEYRYGDFRGNAEEMLRRGYDLHLHYANFGIRKLLIRLPHGLPDAQGAKPYLGKDSLRFLKDKQGPGGILAIEPVHEPGDLDELWEIGAIVDRLVPLRAEILDGDLRPLYLAHLAVACDGEHDPEETREAPVPAGLDALSDAQRALAELYGIGDELIAAAAEKSPPIPARDNPAADYTQWLRGQHEATKNAWLATLMADANSAVRAEIMAKYRSDNSLPTWPTTLKNRTISQLHAAAADCAREAQRKAAEIAARQRAKRLAQMATDPTATLRETERLVKERSTNAYRRIAESLADLSEALAESGRAALAEKQAQKLKAANPKLHLLTSELRRKGFVPK
jgi:hypothetical protein